MIFSKKIYKLASGNNASLFVENEETLSIFIYDNITSKYYIDLSSNQKTEATNLSLAYNQITKLNKEHSCVCYDKNISIINNEKQNL